MTMIAPRFNWCVVALIQSALLCACAPDQDNTSSDDLSLLANILGKDQQSHMQASPASLENSLAAKPQGLSDYYYKLAEPLLPAESVKRDDDDYYDDWLYSYVKRRDPYGVGSRFGKRAGYVDEYDSYKRTDPYSVGGHFGKRGDPLVVGGRFGKRGDSLTLGGRFGKRADPLTLGGRFGKRADPLTLGGHFGKRYDALGLAGRFGKRTMDDDVMMKRYDSMGMGGGFGKRAGDGDSAKRVDKYALGGRFGRDVEHVEEPTQ